VSKKDNFKDKIKGTQRNARSVLMDDTNENVNDNINVYINDNVDNNNNIDNDFLNQLVQKPAPKKKSDSLINSGVYFEEDVFKILMDLSRKGGRGTKSRIVNDALKVAFKNAGLTE
jgi:UTP-glucose-1-phosphate uridylyltransferase